MSTTHPPTPHPEASCPPGCAPDLWSSIVASQVAEALPTIAAVFAAQACPSWCVEHTECGDDPSVVHEGATSYFGDADDAPDHYQGARIRLEADWTQPGLWPARINVWGDADLTPADARLLAAHLVALADVAEQTVGGQA